MRRFSQVILLTILFCLSYGLLVFCWSLSFSKSLCPLLFSVTNLSKIVWQQGLPSRQHTRRLWVREDASLVQNCFVQSFLCTDVQDTAPKERGKERVNANLPFRSRLCLLSPAVLLMGVTGCIQTQCCKI